MLCDTSYTFIIKRILFVARYQQMFITFFRIDISSAVVNYFFENSTVDQFLFTSEMGEYIQGNYNMWLCRNSNWQCRATKWPIYNVLYKNCFFRRDCSFSLGNVTDTCKLQSVHI